MAGGRNDSSPKLQASLRVLVRLAGHVGYELIGAAMLSLAGGGRGFPLNYDELDTHRVRAGAEVTQGER
jgi:hypothetical protein